MSHKVDGDRIKKLNSKDYTEGLVCYWMNRDCRVEDNWALLFAQQKAIEYEVPLVVVYNLDVGFLGGGYRQHHFKVTGLCEVAKSLQLKRIPFFLITESSDKNVLLEFLEEKKVGCLVTDFSPLKIQRQWVSDIRKEIEVPLYGVDAHNIVPVWETSDKKEFAARTIRPKIKNKLSDFLTPFPSLLRHPHEYKEKYPEIEWEDVINKAVFSDEIKKVKWIEPGFTAAREKLKYFVQQKLEGYALRRNDPNLDGISDLSPYLHYGQIAPQRVALEVERAHANGDDKEAYLEELIVRRELADNFCFYEPEYDSFGGIHDWAKKTLEEHREDNREYTYTKEEFEQSKTHDDLWNAAQAEMVTRGKMHGFMRMYWAKKILEWTRSPEEAFEIAIYLNDKYQLDGRDPNGYTGIAWSIGGIHDRAWTERPVFGKIRFMNYAGCKRKFDVDRYINTHLQKNPEPKSFDL